MINEKYLIFFVIFNIINLTICNEVENCPKDCFCQWQHWKELAVMQYMQIEQDIVDSAHYLYTNDATQYEDISIENNPLIKAAICVSQSNGTIKSFLTQLPSDIEALSLIQGFDEPTQLTTNDLNHLQFLKILEIKGSENFENKLTLIIETPLKDITYLNLENIHLEGSGIEIKTLQEKFNEALQKLQFVSTDNSSNTENDIVPYEVYKEQERRKKLPMFKGHDNLMLLRISGCKLNEIIWEMFDQLGKLRYMYLENNELKIIPPFAFYSVPKLQFLSLAKNHLLDINVSDLSGLLDLEYLDLSFNNFTQLSELSFPPFPKLKLADFRNNPITTIYSNTFEVMNTTKSIILGNSDTQITITTNAFIGLNQLEKLNIYNLKSIQLNREILFGLKNLKEFQLTGEIKQIEFDTFVDMKQLEVLILNHCNLEQLSMDTFIGARKLQILDLSHNQLKTLPLGIFDSLISIREILLNDNLLSDLPQGIFYKTPAKLIRLNNNPWQCTCNLMHWSASIINRIKLHIPKQCRHDYDKGLECKQQTVVRYVYDRRVAPLCQTPKVYANKGVFQAIKKMHCHETLRKRKLTQKVINYLANGVTINKNSTNKNDLYAANFNSVNNFNRKMAMKNLKKLKKYRKNKSINVSEGNNDNNVLNNYI